MKYTFSVIISLLAFCSIRSFGQDRSLTGQISISGVFALFPMTVKWPGEYKKVHPGVKIDICAGGAGKGISDALSGMVDIGMVSREIYPEELKKGAYPVAVTWDAVVATVNGINPVIKEILAKGLKKEDCNHIRLTGKYSTWERVTGVRINSPLHVYTRSDACGAAETWAKFCGKKQEDLLGIGVFGDPGLAQALLRDPLGIGFNGIGYVYDPATRKQIKGLRVVPIDLDGNGKIDPDEDFYESLSDVIKAISTGKYPSPPARELYFVTKGKPGNRLVADFIRWVLNEGQKYANEAGYNAQPRAKSEVELKKL